MLVSIVFIPFITFLVLSLFGRNLGQKGAGFIGVGFITISGVLSCIAFYKVGILGSFKYLTLGT